MTYREKGKARSPALEKLAAEARKDDAAPAQTTMLSEAEITRRLELATGVHTDRTGCLPIVAMFLSLFALYGLILAGKSEFHLTGGEKFLVGLLVFSAIASVFGSFYVAAASATRREKGIEAELAWPASQPFPITGYRDWLVNDRSVLVVQLRDSIEKATFVDAVRAIDPAIEAVALDEKTFELVVPSRVITGESATRYGNVQLLKTVVAKLLRPLHDDVGIERVTMGGTIQERS